MGERVWTRGNRNRLENIYKSQLGIHVWSNYPLIREDDPEILEAFMSEKIPFSSFRVTGNEDLLRDVLAKSLIRAANSHDAAYSHHGAEHDSFHEAMDLLTGCVGSGEYTLASRISTADIKNRFLPETRYVVEGVCETKESNPAHAIAVFLDLQSVAHQFANQKWPWKRRIRYIWKKYGEYSTTRVITAFLKNNSQPPFG